MSAVNSQKSPLDLLYPSHLGLWQISELDKGEIFTNRQTVEFMISALGIPQSIMEAGTKILEPSCGQGEFVLALAKILCSEIKKEHKEPDLEALSKKILAFDISKDNLLIVKDRLLTILLNVFSLDDAYYLIEAWLRHEDFLLAEIDGEYSHILGNPPYIRVENIPKPILTLYREIFEIMTDRADIYIAFFEKGLKSLQ